MQAKQMQAFTAVYNVTTFLDTFAAYLPRTNASRVRQELDALAARSLIDADIQVFETRAYHEAVVGVGVARRALFLSHLAPLVAAARIVGAPELSMVRLPRHSVGIPELAATALDMAERAGPFTTELVGAGLSHGFPERLYSAVDELERAVSTVSRHLIARMTATNRLESDSRLARLSLRLLDRLARSELGAEHPLLDRWNRVKRLPKPGEPVRPARRRNRRRLARQ